jgi:ABC-2 type transport system permease protein
VAERLQRRIARHLGLLGAYLVQYAKVRVSYRADFLIGLATSMAATVFAFGFVLVLFGRIPRLADWRFEEVLFLYGFSLIPFGLFNVISMNIYEFGNTYIIEGKFDRVLLRPVGTLFQVLFEAFRIESLHEVLVGLAAIWWASRRMGLEWTAADAGLLLFFGLCGAVIYISFFVMLASASFWFEDRIGIIPPVWNLLAFGRYPLSIYSPFVRFVLSWIVPFGFATFYPTVRLLGREDFSGYAPLVPLVAAATAGLALLVWSRGVRQYASTGS